MASTAIAADPCAITARPAATPEITIEKTAGRYSFSSNPRQRNWIRQKVAARSLGQTYTVLKKIKGVAANRRSATTHSLCPKRNRRRTTHTGRTHEFWIPKLHI